MREILFRGKRVNNGEWVEGLYWTNHAFNAHYILEQTEKYSGGWESQRFEIIQNTVGQYTGLTDKNGKKIFEGDILSTDLSRPYLIVEFRNGAFMLACHDDGRDYYDYFEPVSSDIVEVVKYHDVVGNIHDNPELLEEE